MNSITAENRGCWHPRYQSTKGIPAEPTNEPDTGYYLALTFGTLLSSQGADAQELNPSGHRPQLDVQLYAGFQQHPPGGWTGDPPGPRGAGGTVHDLRRLLHGVPGHGPAAGARRERASGGGHRGPFSGDATGAELDAHPRTHRLRRLGDAVLPGALAGATHDDEVAVTQGEPQALPAADRSQHERSR
jgi:hypothetical protein